MNPYISNTTLLLGMPPYFININKKFEDAVEKDEDQLLATLTAH